MKLSTQLYHEFRLPKFGRLSFYAVLLVFIFLLSILQDYIYSCLQHTGFYISESLLYNTFWIFVVPFSLLINLLTRHIHHKRKSDQLIYRLSLGIVFSFLHIVLFTSLFIGVSHLLFTPPHRFSAIFNAASSNQFYIILFWYSIFPTIYSSLRPSSIAEKQYQDSVQLKIGTTIKTIPIASIQYISTDRPYSGFFTEGQKFLDRRSLKELETQLDPTIFLRIHRSTIVNTNYIKELKSRNNGDYDAILESGKVIRFSRHYRSNWSHLLQ